MNKIPAETMLLYMTFIMSFFILGFDGEIQAQTHQAKTQKAQPKLSSKSPAEEPPSQRTKDFLAAKQVVFLGDSNTHRGEYIVQIETMLRANYPSFPELINLGLSSETCCGLSEPVHPFPRPNVHERLDRVLTKSKPDFVFACYGMNDGIYHPFDESRFEKFKHGVNDLITKVNLHGAKLVLITPPPFDAHAMKGKGMLAKLDAKEFSWTRVYENYEEDVIGKYSSWMLELEKNDHVYAVVDAHSVVKTFILNQRHQDPKFSFSPDGVHFHLPGHRVMAQSILHAFGFNESLPKDKALIGLVRERQAFSHASWLSHVGHLRPGIKEGMAFDDLPEKLAAIDKRIVEHQSANQRKTKSSR